jgi:DNA/RNA-binding domain of Phe-tRNA-synthetase-like protein
VISLSIDPHPALELGAFVSVFPQSLGAGWPVLALPALLERTPPELSAPDAKAPVRDLLRHGGFKPAGRNKPASEYVQKAIPAGKLGAINAAVDACNAASFRSGLPISVVDVDRLVGVDALRVGIAPAGSEYVFNSGGQIIDVGGLLVLFDGEGPCANAVKDSQRTKTHDGTTRTLSLVWGTSELPGWTSTLVDWYRSALEDAGVRTENVERA